MILCEGPSRTGKTELAIKLREALPGWSYRSGREGKQIGAGPNHLLSLVADCQPRVILDEFHCTARLSRTLRANYPHISPQQWKVLELALMSRGALVAWCAPRRAMVGEMLLPLEETPAATDRILTGAEPCHLTRYHFNDSESDAVVLERLIESAKREAGRVSALPSPSQGIGSRDAQFLVLGEGPPSQLDFREPDLPFSRGSAAAWLWKAFEVIGLEWHRGYFTNASSFRSVAAFTDLVIQQLTAIDRIVCIGKGAEGLAKLAAQRSDRFPEVRMVRPHSLHREFDTWTGEIGEVLKGWCGGMATLTLDGVPNQGGC